ncbi:MAG: glycosyltransferase family 4 protein [Chloroflexota bacterium]|nr:glycosyltransferase family 4 protein [Chloroflexota bacterium]
MRILHVANGFPPTSIAGVEQYTHALAYEQMQRHDVSVFCREYAPNLAEYTVRDEVQAGLSIRRVVNNFRRVSSLETHYRNPVIENLFSTYLQETRPDVIHFQHCVGLSAGLPAAARELGIPFVLTLHDYWYICSTTRLLTRDMTLCPGPHHGADCRQCLGSVVQASGLLHRIPLYPQVRDALVPYKLQHKILTWLERAHSGASSVHGPTPQPFANRMRFMQQMLNTASRLLAPSDFCGEVYLDYGVHTETIRVLPAGLDLDHWQHKPSRVPAPSLRFGYIGALSAHKGVDVLVRAFQHLPNAGVELHLFGSGAPNDPFAAHLKKAAVKDSRIHFRGRYENQRLPELLAGIDAIVVPSRWHETFSIVTHEALLAGLAVVASHVGAIPEVITDGINGLLVPPSDEIALTAALARLAGDRALVGHLAQGARSTPVKGIKAHALEVEAIYQKVADEGYG